MRRILIPTLALVVLCGFMAQQADAASAHSLLYPYDVSLLEDQDFELIVQPTPSATLESDDLLIGMFEISKSGNETGPGVDRIAVTNGATYSGVFVLKYTGTFYTNLGVGADETWYQFAPVAVDWATLGFGLPSVSAGTVALIVDNDNYGPYSGGSFVEPELATTALSLASALNGTKAWEFGFTGAAGADEFWLASTISTLGSDLSTLQFYASMNVTKPYAAPQLLPHDYYFNGGGGEFLDPADVLGFGTIISQLHVQGARSGNASGPFTLETDTDFYVYATPEPGSLILLGLGLAACGGAVYRRRRNK